MNLIQIDMTLNDNNWKAKGNKATIKDNYLKTI